jgi:hypothetical protein
MSTQPSTREDARAYIDRIVEINKRHGMGSQMSNEAYERVVRSTERALARLVPNGGARS